MTPLLVLVGPPGSGKTTVGRLVADRRGVEFRDTDHDVETVAGKPVADIFVEDGEAHFRALERDAVETGAADRRYARRAVPRAFHRRRSDARL